MNKNENKVSTKDIYIKVGHEVVESGFWEQNLEGKKNLINKALISYTLIKLQELNPTIKVNEEESLESLCLIVNKLLITHEEKSKFYSNYTHYLINVISNLQGRTIIWWEEKEQELINMPLIEFADNGVWDTLKTHEKTFPSQITLFVLDIFNKLLDKDNKTSNVYQKEYLI